MKEHEHTPPETVLCGRCATLSDPDDNFCRHCGLSLHDPQLPALRDGAVTPAVWRPPLPAAVAKGAAFVAAGTVAEILVRRLLRGTLTRRQPATRRQAELANGEASLPEDTQMVSETLLLRRIRFRR